MKKFSVITLIGPGLLVAATGVGASDLATGAFAGTKLGLAVLWAVIVGAGLKFLLNEGLARWQLATGETLLEGCVAHFGRPLQWGFLVYLLTWSYFVGSALMSAIGMTAHALVPLFEPETDKIIYGLLHSGIAVALVGLGSYRLFSKVMGACIAIMFVVVITTAIALRPSWQDVCAGLFVPTIPDVKGSLAWTIALMGGVGGTLTVLCYGYWSREEGRQGIDDLQVCRIDLVTGYTMTAFFGIAMVIIGSRIHVSGGGATLVVDLAELLFFLLVGWFAIQKKFSG
jgi:Mn2+/Fe2+ NRAMP family transporter